MNTADKSAGVLIDAEIARHLCDEQISKNEDVIILFYPKCIGLNIIVNLTSLFVYPIIGGILTIILYILVNLKYIHISYLIYFDYWSKIQNLKIRKSSINSLLIKLDYSIEYKTNEYFKNFDSLANLIKITFCDTNVDLSRLYSLREIYLEQSKALKELK